MHLNKFLLSKLWLPIFANWVKNDTILTIGERGDINNANDLHEILLTILKKPSYDFCELFSLLSGTLGGADCCCITDHYLFIDIRYMCFCIFRCYQPFFPIPSRFIWFICECPQCSHMQSFLKNTYANVIGFTEPTEGLKQYIIAVPYHWGHKPQLYQPLLHKPLVSRPQSF